VNVAAALDAERNRMLVDKFLWYLKDGDPNAGTRKKRARQDYCLCTLREREIICMRERERLFKSKGAFESKRVYKSYIRVRVVFDESD
jgi:hypothetical protein